MNGALAKPTATVYRMFSDEHVCPWGVRVHHLLKRKGYEIDDHHMDVGEDKRFKRKQGVETTPQVFIDGKRIGGYEDTRRHLGLHVKDPDAKTYTPIVAVFGLALVLALAVAWRSSDWSVRVVGLAVALAMVLLALQKLRDLGGFATRFLSYDLLAQRWVPYGYAYPFVEAGAGLLMVAGWLPLLAGPAAFFIGTVGTISIVKVVYVDKRDLECACVGGNGNVPLGPVSLLENLMMMAMGVAVVWSAI